MKNENKCINWLKKRNLSNHIKNYLILNKENMETKNEKNLKIINVLKKTNKDIKRVKKKKKRIDLFKHYIKKIYQYRMFIKLNNVF